MARSRIFIGLIVSFILFIGVAYFIGANKTVLISKFDTVPLVSKIVSSAPTLPSRYTTIKEARTGKDVDAELSYDEGSKELIISGTAADKKIGDLGEGKFLRVSTTFNGTQFNSNVYVLPDSPTGILVYHPTNGKIESSQIWQVVPFADVDSLLTQHDHVILYIQMSQTDFTVLTQKLAEHPSEDIEIKSIERMIL